MFRASSIALLLVTAPAAAAERGKPPAQAAPSLPDGAHDFDFEMGSWRAHIERRLRPLTGSDEWVAYDGVSTVRPLWGGKGNIGELDVSGLAGRIQGLSLRLYDPASRQWSIRWANARDGSLGTPMMGGFAEARGLFHDQETLDGRAILVRFIFSPVRAGAFRIEQAFSADGGATWETNWISDFRK